MQSMQSVPSEIQQIHDTGVVSGKSGRTYEVRDAIDQEEGDFLFNFIFVDGWHTVDQVLLDCFMRRGSCALVAISRLTTSGRSNPFAAGLIS